MGKGEDIGHTEIRFEAKGASVEAPLLTIKGARADLVNRPERIRELMDLLELPEGTDARIVYMTSDVIVR